MSMLIRDFPDELRFRLRAKALEAGVTLRELVISVLEEWEGGRLKVLAGLVAGGKAPKAREEFVNPVITDEYIDRLSKQAPGKPSSPPTSVTSVPPPRAGKMTLGEEQKHRLDDDWEPERPQISNPWDGAYEKTRARKKP